MIAFGFAVGMLIIANSQRDRPSVAAAGRLAALRYALLGFGLLAGLVLVRLRDRRAHALGAVAAGQDIAHEMYHDDAVLEFPQSGERFDGLANFRQWRSQYPADVEFEVRNLRGDGDLWVAESAIRYEGAPWQPGVSVLEFCGDKVARETIYVTESWEAPEWRARWRAAP